ncbi:MAG: hypothetical protein JWN44_5161 [Myxococcales bacterium]|nr:hypothetical protein [Myxococcales bacterium]
MRTLALIAVTLGATAALAHSQAKAMTQNEFKVAPKATIVVDSSAGGVELSPGPAGVVKIEAERQASSEDEARKLDVQTKLDGNTVRVTYKHDGGNWHDNASVSFRISAPADTKIEVRTGGGGVDVHGFSSGVRVDTGGGGIEISDTAGALQLRSGGGSIEVKRVKGTVDVSTGGGSVRVEGALSGRNRVETGGGSIKVAIPGASKLSVDASTGGGSARNDFGIPGDGERHSGRFHGNIGDGTGGSLELRTGGGSIHLGKDG